MNRPTSSYLNRKRSKASKPTLKKLRKSPSKQKRLRLEEEKPFHKHSFRFLHVVGRGGFGRVWKVELKRTRRSYAMKEMLKLRVVNKRSVHSVLNERFILEKLRHPFIANMHFAFQDRENLYLVLDLLPGGDLRYHLARHAVFTEEQTRFFIACIILGLEYLHVNGIIHRDIKPENLVLDTYGYVHISDFGVARVLAGDNARDTSGTPGYMAPEVLCRQNHGIGVDYFAVGVIAYEFMLGHRPYVGRNRNEIRDHVLSKQVQIKEVPKSWSYEAVDFINSLLQRKPSSRLGVNGPYELKSHRWFRDFPWMALLSKSLPSPFLPGQEDNFDVRVNEDWKDELSQPVGGIQHLFENYTFN